MAIDGTYDIEIDLPAGKDTGKGIMKTDGNVLSGALVDKDGTESPFDGGTIEGGAFSFTVNVKGPAGPMQMEISGTAEGDTLSGEMKGPGFAIKFAGSRT